MKKILHQHTISFVHAFAGVVWSFKTQPNFRIHIFLTVCTVVGAWFFRITSVEFLILVFTIVLGFAAEMINTAIESVTDLVTTEWKQEAKIAKDVSAGMMLLVACGALVVAGVIFIPYILPYFS